MGLHPLNLAPDMANLRNWLIQKGIQKLVDICTWDSEGNWSKWDLHCPPDWMLPQFHQLFDTHWSGSCAPAFEG